MFHTIEPGKYDTLDAYQKQYAEFVDECIDYSDQIAADSGCQDQ